MRLNVEILTMNDVSRNPEYYQLNLNSDIIY